MRVGVRRGREGETQSEPDAWDSRSRRARECGSVDGGGRVGRGVTRRQDGVEEVVVVVTTGTRASSSRYTYM